MGFDVCARICAVTKARGHFGNGGIENRLFANGGGRNALMSSVRIASGARQTETDISIIFEKERASLLFGKRASFFCRSKAVRERAGQRYLRRKGA